MPLEPLPPLKTDPAWGRYPWWPEDGDGWVHPEDVSLARRTVPGPRVWRRDGVDGPFVVLHYGRERMRVKRTLWIETPNEGFDVGDFVRVVPRGLRNEAVFGAIRDVFWEDEVGALRYRIETADETQLEKLFEAADLRHAETIRPLEEGRLDPSGEDPGLELEGEEGF